MITSIDVISPIYGHEITLILDGEPNGYVVENVAGIGPVSASFSTVPFAQLDGVSIQNGRRESRNIVFSLGYDPDYVTTTVPKLRQRLQRNFKTKMEVTLVFHSDDLPDLTINGWVESCEPEIFTSTPKMSISIICPGVDFMGPEKTVSFTNAADFDSTPYSLTYDGSSPTGIELTYTVPTYVNSDMTVAIDSISQAQTRFSAKQKNAANVEYYMNSKIREKAFKANDQSALVLIDEIPEQWPQLYPGLNKIFVIINSGVSIPIQMTYREMYDAL